MFAKVHPAEDVKSGNTGSCHDPVRYLEKETGEGQDRKSTRLNSSH